MDDYSEAETMDDVEELGKLVYKLSQEQLNALQEEIAAKQAEQEGALEEEDQDEAMDEQE